MRAQHLLLVIPAVTAYSVNWQKPPKTVPGSVSQAAEVEVPRALGVPLQQEEPLLDGVVDKDVSSFGAELLRKAEAQHGTQCIGRTNVVWEEQAENKSLG